ncbi:D-3-phosphoglycerate dehydrogenase [Strongyloides ratti]|uniref:D-3-phosphoglycerate dehydrogenase n=1 Tax=Strongyloides ratti TaxID=34506 RepID=A0A090MYV0_STRRB|nr:D-3-phosphoglycerate dehydrogenase [Strongyloides ratti]CEF67819.1 D-3-phosphoglycerate dehydrogenase [Strongyloides ratti]
MAMISNVFIADEIEKECIDTLLQHGISVTVRKNETKDQLLKILPLYDAVIVRSATKITSDLIEAGVEGRLKVIGRAGTGVDNIDIKAATKNGVLVMNTPSGNSQSAAELTCTLILSLARRVPQADASMKARVWARKNFMGEEVGGKILGIIGLGRIGQMVASRMQAFGMKVVGYDPFISKEIANQKGIELLSLDEIYPISDYITVHVPLTKETENLINKETLSRCKKGVKIINVARGGIVNEEDLVSAINNGHVSGAAFDVYSEEPPKYYDLIENNKIISTPHLGASTIEAQNRVAVEIAQNIISLNEGKENCGALNANEVLSRR